MSRSDPAALAGVTTLLIDLDGVIYRGAIPMPGADRLLPALDKLGIDHVFVTNNSAASQEEVASRLTGMGVATDPDHVMTSAVATAEYLRATFPQGSTVLVVGEEGLKAALTSAGFRIVDKHPCEIVVSGLDRTLTYDKLAEACLAIRAGAQYVATNADPAIPVEAGFWPGAGSIAAAIRTASNVEPVIIGKPAPQLLRSAMAQAGAQPAQTAMVGDQISSDIKAGVAAGTRTVLVGHDQSTQEIEPRPDVWVDTLDQLIEVLRASR